MYIKNTQDTIRKKGRIKLIENGEKKK